MPDKTLTCRECSASFVFTAEEQQLFAQRGYTNEPRRCPTCREARRERSSYGGGSYSSGGGYGQREREMFNVVCAQCGKDTQVPFSPRGDRPVYCRECFDKVRGPSEQSRRPSW